MPYFYVVLFLPLGGSASSSLSVIVVVIFKKNICLEECFETSVRLAGLFMYLKFESALSFCSHYEM
jgi:hypothetical protein